LHAHTGAHVQVAFFISSCVAETCFSSSVRQGDRSIRWQAATATPRPRRPWNNRYVDRSSCHVFVESPPLFLKSFSSHANLIWKTHRFLKDYFRFTALLTSILLLLLMMSSSFSLSVMSIVEDRLS
jgi:hypothetical protein